MSGGYMQIGEVAEQTGLSLSTIRRYEDLGLLGSPRRSQGGFRLYTRVELGRLRLLRDMRPLEFSIEEQRGLLATLDALSQVSGRDTREHAELHARLQQYVHAIDQRITALGHKVSTVEALAARLAAYLELSASGFPPRLLDAEDEPAESGAAE